MIKMNNRLLFFAFLFILFSCDQDKENLLETGRFRGVLKVSNEHNLPFLFDVKNDSLIYIYNANETIKVTEISKRKDSVIIKAPVFEGYLIAKIDGEKLNGKYVNESMRRSIPFVAFKDSTRFTAKKAAKFNVAGNWETTFTAVDTNESYISKGVFKQTNNIVTGTFRTITGDYRFLEGIVDGDSLKLSTYDGARALLFLAKVTDTVMSGVFYKGNHSKEIFKARKNNSFSLPNEKNLVAIKKGYENFDFSFTDTRGRVVSLSDEQFKNKAIVIQIMGSWCANCLDESKFFVEYQAKNPNKDLQFIALAFETARTREKAYQRINDLTKRIGIKYPVLLAQYGNEESKERALEKLPMLTNLISYPTTIYLDKNKNLVKIESSFNGPATGTAHEKFKKSFNNLINSITDN